MSESPPPSPSTPSGSPSSQQRWLVVLPIIAGVALLAIAVLLVIVLGLKSLFGLTKATQACLLW